MADKKNNSNPQKGLKIQTWLYIILFIGFGAILFGKEDKSSLTGKATYTEFKRYMELGYVNNIVIYPNLGVLEMYIKPDSAKYVFNEATSSQPFIKPMLTVGVGSLDNLQEFIDTSQQSGNFTGEVEYEKNHIQQQTSLSVSFRSHY